MNSIRDERPCLKVENGKMLKECDGYFNLNNIALKEIELLMGDDRFEYYLTIVNGPSFFGRNGGPIIIVGENGKDEIGNKLVRVV